LSKLWQLDFQDHKPLYFSPNYLSSKGITFRSHDITFDIHPKSKDKINDQRRTHCEERNINKPGADTGSGNSKTIADSSTYAEQLPFNEYLHPVHNANLKKIS
jgi:hypothetical protein